MGVPRRHGKRTRSVSPMDGTTRAPPTPRHGLRPGSGSPGSLMGHHRPHSHLNPTDAYDGLGAGDGSRAGETEAGLRAGRVQVLQDVLRRTSLAELRDREIVEWLSDTEGWLRKGEAAFASAPCAGAATATHFPGAAELRLLVLGVLHTMPWWRVVESLEGVGGGVAAPSPSAPAQAAAAAVTRWHERIQAGFERVCLVLVAQSQHVVPGVLEVVMRPFHLRPPVQDGVERVVPTDTLLRILDAMAAHYGAGYVLELLPACIGSLLPKRRWPDARHHMAATAVLMHLALVPTLPARELGSGNRRCLTAAYARMAALTVALPDDLAGDQDGGARERSSGSTAREGAAGVRGGSSGTVSKAPASLSLASSMTAPLPNRLIACRASIVRFQLDRLLERELSLESGPSAGEPPDDTLSLATDDVSDVASLTSTAFSGVVSGGRWVGPRPLRSPASPHFSPASPPSLPRTALTRPVTSSPSAAGNRAAVAEHERPSLRTLVECARLCLAYLLDDQRRHRAVGGAGAYPEWWREVLATYLLAARRVGSPKCLLFLAPTLARAGGEGAASDLLHKLVTLVIKGYVPVPGPSTGGLSALGCVGGVAASATARAAAAPVRMRMALPGSGVGPAGTLAAQPVPRQERLRAARHLYPLFCFLRDRLDSPDAVRRRLMKWVSGELLRLSDGESAGAVSRESREGGPALSAAARATLGSEVTDTRPTLLGGTTARTSGTSGSGARGSRVGGSGVAGGNASRLVQVVFAQAAAMAAAEGVDVVTGEPVGAAAGRVGRGCTAWMQDAVRPLLERYVQRGAAPAAANDAGVVEVVVAPGGDSSESGGGVTPAGSLDIAAMEEAGLLQPSLMEGCPWAIADEVR